MFSSSIENKANKIKQNVDTYLNNQPKKEVYSPPVPSIRRPEAMPGSATPMPSTLNPMNPPQNCPPPIKTSQIQIKKLILQGKDYEKGPMSLKCVNKEKLIQINYFEETSRFKLQISGRDKNCDVRLSQEKGLIQIAFKKLRMSKFFKQEKDSNESQWMITKEIRDSQIQMVVGREAVKISKSMFDVVPEENLKMDFIVETGKAEQKQKDEMGEVDSETVNFCLPTPQQLIDSDKLRKGIKEMKEEEKITILLDIFKIKKQFEDGLGTERKKRCPIHSCQKTYRETTQMRTHLKKHPELARHGIQLTEYSIYEYSNKALDLALYLGKMFPQEMKKIIRKMKTKQVAE